MDSIQNYLKQNAISGISQNTDEWAGMRHNTIGGSEVSALLGVNDYKSRYELFTEKTRALLNGHRESVKNVAIAWGNLFEPVAERIFSTAYMHETGRKCSDIHGADAFMVDKENSMSLSPDGLVYDHDTDEVLLLEIKCPYRRRRHELPGYYLPQIIYGMNFIDIANRGVYYQLKVERAPLLGEQPVDGVIVIWHSDHTGGYTDLGGLSQAQFEKLMGMYDVGHYNSRLTYRYLYFGCGGYGNISTPADRQVERDFANHQYEHTPLFILPWRCSSHFVKMVSDAGVDFENQYKGRIIEFMDDVRRFVSADDEKTRRSLMDKYYHENVQVYGQEQL